MERSAIALRADFPQWRSNHCNAQVVLTFSNPTNQPETIVLPCPLDENAAHFASPDKPTLVLVARYLPTQTEEGFVLTSWGNEASAESKSLTLNPGESIQVPYSLASLYSWGHAGPTKSAGFLDCLRPGEREVVVRALIAYSDVEPGKGEHIESSSVVLKCAFPEWLFKAKDVEAEQSSHIVNDSPK